MTTRTTLLALGLILSGAHASAQGSFVHWETPHVRPLELTPDRSTLLAVNLPDNRLEVFDVTSGSPVWQRSIEVGLDPVSVRARSNTEAWVVNHVSDSVSVVDLPSARVVATLWTDDEPADVVFSASPELAFVSCSQANTVQVFDPAALGEAPLRIPIEGEDPRALAVSPDGQRVYVAIFESGNLTTILGNGGFVPNDFPFNVIQLFGGPHGGMNPPPNAGTGFEPPIDGDLDVPPGVSQIVRQDALGRWMDDNGGDWSAFISGARAHLTGRVGGWTMPDHDVAILDVASATVTYADHLMNLCMALAVNPVTGAIGVVGTEATNEQRFEPNLSGRFLRVLLGSVDPDAPASASLADLNGHLDYASSTVPPAERAKTLSDPRGIVWNGDGTRAFVTGMGTNNVVVLDETGARVGQQPAIDVGEGPTGIVLDEPRQRLYVLNKFEATLSVIDLVLEAEIARVPFFDPTPAPIRVGRKHLYDARETSGLGLTSCASCHADARMDRLAWDLGSPTGDMDPPGGINFDGGRSPAGTEVDYHPMKGPMLTQTLQDIIGFEPFHWRGDRDGIESFNPAFEGLLGDDEQLTPAEMQEFEDFLASIAFPPNPYRKLDNGLPHNLSLAGHFSAGRFTAAGTPMPDGDAARGRVLYGAPGFLCTQCHTLPTGQGTNTHWNGITWLPITAGPLGEDHHSVFPPVFEIRQNVKIPNLRNLYERTGFDGTQQQSRAGFGMRHDGAIDSLVRFVSRPHFSPAGDQDVSDIVAFLLCLSGETEVAPVTNDVNQPPGSPGQSTHAAVGKQITIAETPPSSAARAFLDLLLAEADDGDIGIVVRGRWNGIARGFYYTGDERFQSDRRNERVTRDALLAAAGPGAELTFTAVPEGSQVRIGADRDSDHALDRDELDLHTDPQDPTSRPKAAHRDL